MKKKNFFISITIMLILFLLLIYSYQYDGYVSKYIDIIHTDYLDYIMLGITNLGHAVVLLIIALFLLVSIDYRSSKNITELLIGGVLSNTLIKLFFKRPRPFSLFYEHGYSFPSAHMMLSVMFYGYLCYLMYHSKAKKPYKIIFFTIMGLLVSAIGFSRIYINVHYVSDVVGGILFGYLLLLLFIIYTKQKYRLIDESIRLDKSFKYAFKGIKTVVLYEKNMHIHVIAAIIVIIMGLKFNISTGEWITCFILFALVFSSEIFNTAIEKCVDYISEDKNQLAAAIKDMSAGAVLVNAIVSAIVGLIIFLPKIIEFLK